MKMLGVYSFRSKTSNLYVRNYLHPSCNYSCVLQIGIYFWPRARIGSIYPNSVDIVSCFCSLISKIRQIYIISAQFCGWKCALVAPINVNLTVKVEWFFRFRFRLFTSNISCYNQKHFAWCYWLYFLWLKNELKCLFGKIFVSHQKYYCWKDWRRKKNWDR